MSPPRGVGGPAPIFPLTILRMSFVEPLLREKGGGIGSRIYKRLCLLDSTPYMFMFSFHRSFPWDMYMYIFMVILKGGRGEM